MEDYPQGKTMLCPHGVAIATGAECSECARVARAALLVEQVLAQIEKHDNKQQQYILECGMRLRELLCYYGPYFKLASMLTNCEISSGAIVLNDKTAPPCETATEDAIMLPGMKSKGELREIILPGNKTLH